MYFLDVSYWYSFTILIVESSLLKRFIVKSPESHLARSHVARNLSHVARNFSYVARKKKVKSPEETNTKKIWISDC